MLFICNHINILVINLFYQLTRTPYLIVEFLQIDNNAPQQISIHHVENDAENIDKYIVDLDDHRHQYFDE